MSVLFIVGPTCTLAALHCESVNTPTGQTDGRTDGRQIITLRFPLDAASIVMYQMGFSSPQTNNSNITVKMAAELITEKTKNLQRYNGQM